MELTRQSPRALARTFGLLAAASGAVVLVLAFPASAQAEPETPPALTADRPTITSPADGSFLATASAVLTGTKAAGSTVQILAGSSRTNVCTVRNADTTFSCSVGRLPSGPRIPLAAVQLIDGEDNLESEPVYVDVLAPPTVAGTSPVLTNGLVQGVGYPNARITLSIGGGSAWSFPAGPDGAWAFVLPRTIGSGNYTLTASQSTTFSQGSQSASSPAVTIRLDVDPPEPPALASPSPNSTVSPSGVRYSGTGENGATVNVFALTASGSDIALCSALVSAGTWGCTGATLPAGTATVTSFQTDAAGNAGAGSAPLSLTISPPSTTLPTPAPSAERDDPAVAPVVPVPPSAPPAPNPPAPVVPAPPDAEFPAAIPPDAGTWDAATPFTTAVPPALGAADLSWLRALLLAAVAVLLLLVPARMLATTVRGRRAGALPVALTGRNRVPTHDDPAPLVTAPGKRVTAAVLVAVAGGIVLFASPVQGELEYLRALLASVVAISLVNLVATVATARLAARLPSGAATVALSPRFLLTVAGVAVFSRVLSLEPALLFGIVFTVTAVSATRSARGIVAGIRIAAVFAVGLLAWLGSTLLGTPTGFLNSLLAETVNVAAMAGVGSAAILLVPLGRLDGRALLLWSRPLWFGAAFVVLTVLFALLAPVVDVWQTSGDALIGLVVVLAFGALGLSLWIWRRLVQPAMASD